jgi:RNA polymerase sigma-70 factor (ECF subfamily)
MEEQELTALLRNNTDLAIEKTVEIYGNRLLRAAFLLCGNLADAEDMTQEAFLIFVKSLDKFKYQSSIYTWLYGILRNLVLKNRRNSARLLFTASIPEEESITPEQGEGLDSMQASRILADALQSIEPEHREIVVLRYYEGLSINEIADQLAINSGTVKSRLFYARQQLSSILPKSLNLFAS